VTPEAAWEEADVLRAERGRILLVAALLSAGLLASSLFRGFHPGELALRIALTLLLGGAPALAGRRPPAQRDFLLAAVLVVATLLFCAIAALAGGVRSLEFSCLVAVPFTAGLVLPQLRWVPWVVGTLVLVSGEAMLLVGGAPVASTLMWGVLLVAGTVLATQGTLAYRRVVASRLAAERASREAAERLVDSEQRRSQSDRLAMVGRLAAGVAHEISNPLTYLSTNLQLLEREASALQDVSHRDVQAAVAESARAVEHIAEVVRDLRRFARSDSAGEAQPVELRAAVEEALRLASVRMRGLALERELNEPVPLVHARRRRLVQVLVNLLVNAADAASAPGARQPRIRISARHTNGTVTVYVEDGGPGLSPEARQHLFEPFFTTKPAGKGTGLGLALSREYIEADGGSLTFEDVPTGGARVAVRLRLA
jgi:signal transduction histidine kinase